MNQDKRPMIIVNGVWVNYASLDIAGHVHITEVAPYHLPNYNITYTDKRGNYHAKKVNLPDVTTRSSGRILLRFWSDPALDNIEVLA